MMILGWLWIRVKCERLAFGLVKRIESHMLTICGSKAEEEKRKTNDWFLQISQNVISVLKEVNYTILTLTKPRNQNER